MKGKTFTLFYSISFLLVLIATPLASFAQLKNMTMAEAATWPKSKFLTYQQNIFAIDDPAGDIILARLMSHFPFDALKLMLGIKKIAVPAENMYVYEASVFCQAKNILDHTCKEEGFVSQQAMKPRPQYVEGKVEPLKQQDLLKAFVRVIQEEYTKSNGHIVPKISEAPRWSKEFLREYTKKYYYDAHSNIEDYATIVDLFDKPLVALFFGSSSRFMTTNKEEDLTRWILSRPIGSVTLLDVFRKSYQLHQGDLHHAFLLAENIFSRRWRHAYREDLQMTRRLKPFTNWKDGFVNDNFGSWYHFWGVAYYGMIRGKDKAVWAANVEHKGSVFLGSDDFETQEHFVNIQGAILGGELRELILSGGWKTFGTSADDVLETSYRNFQLKY